MPRVLSCGGFLDKPRGYGSFSGNSAGGTARKAFCAAAVPRAESKKSGGRKWGNDYLTKKKPLSALLVFALPIIMGNLFQQTYTMVDSAVVGRFVGEQALAAVGASYSLTNIFICVAIGGGMGASVTVSRYFGGKSYGKMKTAISTVCLSFLGISVLLGGVRSFQPQHHGAAQHTGRCSGYGGRVSGHLFLRPAVPLYVQRAFGDVQRARQIQSRCAS